MATSVAAVAIIISTSSCREGGGGGSEERKVDGLAVSISDTRGGISGTSGHAQAPGDSFISLISEGARGNVGRVATKFSKLFTRERV